MNSQCKCHFTIGVYSTHFTEMETVHGNRFKVDHSISISHFRLVAVNNTHVVSQCLNFLIVLAEFRFEVPNPLRYLMKPLPSRQAYFSK